MLDSKEKGSDISRLSLWKTPRPQGKSRERQKRPGNGSEHEKIGSETFAIEPRRHENGTECSDNEPEPRDNEIEVDKTGQAGLGNETAAGKIEPGRLKIEPELFDNGPETGNNEIQLSNNGHWLMENEIELTDFCTIAHNYTLRGLLPK